MEKIITALVLGVLATIGTWTILAPSDTPTTNTGTAPVQGFIVTRMPNGFLSILPFLNSPLTPPLPSPTPPESPATPAKDRILHWGAYTGNYPTALPLLESLIGKEADMQAIFVGWGADGKFPTGYDSLVRQGKTLVIFWEPYGTTLDNIISGKDDSYIKEWAADAKNYGGQIILAPFHEMNGNWDSWGGTIGDNSPAKLIGAWKHIHSFFGDADNVKFAWVVNSTSIPDTAENQLERYYPGDRFVDYVGVDGFNFGDPWQSFDEIFSDPLSRLKKYDKPTYIFSMASADHGQYENGTPVDNGAKASWITDALSSIRNRSDIEGFIWFNENKEENWTINSNAASLEAFKAALGNSFWKS